MQKKGYYCPRCSARVSGDDNTIVTLKGRLEAPLFSVHFDIEIPAQPGVYGAIFSEGVVLKEGAIIDFLCPHCAADLTLKSNQKHAWLKMIEGEGEEKIIVFNKVYGEHSSFIFNTETSKIIASYGEHSNMYLEEFNKEVNFFGF